LSTKQVLIDIENLSKHYTLNKSMFSRKPAGVVKALDHINLKIYEGETLGLIGESGCGKSTLARILMGITDATSGCYRYKGQEITRDNIQDFRQAAHMIFQDPYSSIDPRMTIQRIVEEPLRVHTRMTKEEKEARVLPILEKVGIPKDALAKYPHQFSGGQRQRIGIARALVLNPSFVICDEAVSALDVSIQAQILNLFGKMKEEFQLTYLFISHDMTVVKHVSDRIAVMYLGRIVELADKKELFANALHPYTEALMSAIPIPSTGERRERIILEGDLPSPVNPPPGCPFQTRCRYVCDKCRSQLPELKEVSENHFVACHLHGKEENA